MNKYILLAVLFTFLTITSLMVQAMESYDAGTFGTTEIGVPDIDSTGSELKMAFQGLSAIFKLLTFQITGIPTVVVVLVFYPVTIVFVYMLVDVIKDLVPFT